MADENQSPALAYMQPESRGLSQLDAFDELAKDAGDTHAIQQQAKAEESQKIAEIYQKADAKPDAPHTVKADLTNVVPIDQRAARDENLVAKMDLQNTVQNVTDVAVGVGAGFRTAGKNIYNGVVSFLDEKHKWADEVGTDINNNLNPNAKIAKGVTEFIAPLMAIAGTGGGVLAASGAGAAYNFLAIDPKEQKLADSLNKTWMKNIPVVSDILDGLSTKPTDTEIVGRLKNSAMGLMVDAAAIGTVWSASKVYTNISKLRTPKAISEAVAHTEGTPVVNAVNPEAVGTAAQDAELSAFEEGMKQSGILDPVIKTHTDGTIGVNLASEETSSILDKWHMLSQDVGERLRVPMTDVERDAMGKTLSESPDVFKKLASWTPEQGPLKDTEVRAMQYINDMGTKELGSISDELLKDPNNPLLQAKLARAFESKKTMELTATGAGSEAGASLRTEQALASSLGVDTKEALRLAGAQGRKKMMDKYIQDLGGADAAKKLATNTKILEDFSKIAKMPDDAFRESISQVVTRSKWMRADDAITKIALNGMLSSPSPSIKSVISNTAMSAMTTFENYVEVGVGAITRTANRKTMAEAQAHLGGLIEGFSEAFKPAWNVVKTGEAPRIVRQELVEASTKTLDANDVAFKAIGANVESQGVTGNIVDALALKSMPVRVLMGVDTFFNHANTNAFLAGQAKRYEVSLLQKGVSAAEAAELTAVYRAKPPEHILQAADEFAKTTTFAKELTGLAETINNNISGANQKIPLMRVVIPFFKTKANMVEEVFERSLLAPLIPGDFRDAWRAGGRQQNEALAKVVSGTTTLGILSYMAANGHINGADTDNPEIARGLKDNKSVAPPTSIKVGDKWVSIQGIDPLASLVNAAHFMGKAAGHVSEEEYSQMAVALGAGAASLLSPEESTQAFVDALQIYRGDKGYQDRIAELPPRFIPASGALNTIRKTIDPKIRQTTVGNAKTLDDMVETMKMKVQNTVPYFSKSLPATRNFWGDEIMIPDGLGPDSLSILASTDDQGMKLKNVLEKMDDFFDAHKESMDGLYSKLEIGIPSRFVKNKFSDQSYRLTPEEYGAYQKYRAGIDPYTGKGLEGQATMKEYFDKVFKEHKMFDRDLKDFSPEEYMEVNAKLSKYMSAYKTVADNMILQFKGVGDKMRKQAEQGRSIINAPTLGGVK